MKKFVPAVMAVLVLTALWCGRAWAQAYDPMTGEPPPGSHTLFTHNDWPLVTTDDGKGVKATCVLECYQDELDELHIHADGLKPKGIYSVWLIRKHGDDPPQRARVGTAWEGPKADINWFTAPAGRTAYFRGCLTRCPLGKWHQVELRYHPDGNPKDLEQSVLIGQSHMKGS